jgi:hypothetical protein
LALELTEGDSENDLKAKHAELILKCIWKRSRTTKEDIIKGVINEEDIFTILEEFLQVISPKEWRLRAARKVPLGDMPLRTVKVLIQHAVGKESGRSLNSSCYVTMLISVSYRGDWAGWGDGLFTRHLR